MWCEVTIGKFAEKGYTLPKIILTDPDWFFWAMEKNVFKGTLSREAELIARRAQRIKIPKPDPENWRVEHVLSFDGKYANFQIVPADHPHNAGSSRVIREAYIDMTLPRRLRTYDKAAGKLMVGSLRKYCFGGASLTKARCNAFFSDPANFLSS